MKHSFSGGPGSRENLPCRGYIPPIHQSGNSHRLLHAYIAQYLKEEVAAEGLVRNLPGFSEFLEIAALSYWRLSSGIGVDFLVNHIDCAIEAKASGRVRSEHVKELRELKKEHPEVKKSLLVSLDRHDRETDDGILILHYTSFLEYLWRGMLL